MEELLQQILQECRPYTGQGALASYIPELARQDPDRLGIAVFHKDGTLVEAGDSRRSFTIQSVMKPLSLLLALQDNGRETVRAHVGVEATGKPFDAINVADNALLAKHLNPMVNAGAILMCQLIGGETYDHRFQRLLDFIRRLADNDEIALDQEVYHSEKATGSKNRALAYLLKAHGLIRGDVEELLDCYFRACSIRVSAADLARIGCVLACHGSCPGRAPVSGGLWPVRQRQPHDLRHVRRVRRLCHPGGRTGQKRRRRRHYGRGARPHGRWPVWTGSGRKGQQPGRNPGAGAAVRPPESERILVYKKKPANRMQARSGVRSAGFLPEGYSLSCQGQDPHGSCPCFCSIAAATRQSGNRSAGWWRPQWWR